MNWLSLQSEDASFSAGGTYLLKSSFGYSNPEFECSFFPCICRSRRRSRSESPARLDISAEQRLL